RRPEASSPACAAGTARFSSGGPRSAVAPWTASVTPAGARDTVSSSAKSSSAKAVSNWWYPDCSRARIRRNRLSFACAATRTRTGAATLLVHRFRPAQLAQAQVRAGQRVQTEQRNGHEPAEVVRHRVAHRLLGADPVERERHARRRLERPEEAGGRGQGDSEANH